MLVISSLLVAVALSADEPLLSPLRDRVALGSYVHLAEQPFRDPVAPADLATLEEAVGRQLDVVHYFWSWGRPFSEAVSGSTDTRDLMLSWKPDGAVLTSVAEGGQDAVLDSFAQQARDYGKPVYLRFAWEMNGSWMDYSSAGGGPSAATYVEAWRAMVDRFRAAGADNVQFVWSPNEADSPAVDGNRLEDYWPGADYVDVLGFDAYNWSTREPRRGDGSWRTFRELVEEPYARVTALADDLPVWLCEWGTTEAAGTDPDGADKAEWFASAGALRDFPRLSGLIYFSEDDQRDTQRDWRLDSSPAAARAFGAAFPRRAVAPPAEPTATRDTQSRPPSPATRL